MLETHTDGFCWNMEARNKAPIPRVCDSTPKSTPGVMVYTVASSVGDWVDAVNTAGGANKDDDDDDDEAQPFFSSCHETLLHGAFGLGEHPVSAVVRSPTNDRIVPIVVHEVRTTARDIMTKMLCQQTKQRMNARAALSWLLRCGDSPARHSFNRCCCCRCCCRCCRGIGCMLLLQASDETDRESLACGVPSAQPQGTLVLDAWTFGSNHAFSSPLP